MGTKKKKDPRYLESLADVAQYLGMGVSEFLELYKKGKFPIQPRPRDPGNVWHASDIDVWIGKGKPAVMLEKDPFGLLKQNQ